MISISLVSVIVAAVATFVIGFMFHGPMLGKLWMKLANIHPTGKEKFADMLPQMGWNMLANLVAAYCLAHLIAVYALYQGTSGSVTPGLCVAFIIWFGFIVTGSSMDTIWMGKSKKLWIFEVVASLVSFLVMGAILAAW